MQFVLNIWGQAGTFGPGLPFTQGSEFRNLTLSPNKHSQRVGDMLTGLEPDCIRHMSLNLGP